MKFGLFLLVLAATLTTTKVVPRRTVAAIIEMPPVYQPMLPLVF